MPGSIRTKLIAGTGAVLAAIIAVTTFYFRSRQLDELSEHQRQRLLAYSEMVSVQTASAVAFSDQATAHEVLDSLHVDPDVVSVVLFGEGGERLYQRGAPSAWVQRAAAGVQDTRIVSTSDRTAAVTPVPTLEGPRGTLVIELSTDRIAAHGRVITQVAIVAAGIALLVGFLLVWLLTRSLLRRLHHMAEVAGALGRDAEGGCVIPEGLAVEIEADDELGAFGTAFNHMVTQLGAEQHRLHEAIAELTAAEKKLELRVERRTESLRNVNLQLRNEMERRTQMEIELRQAQKLESVGRLAAGIAHEINTPVQFVGDSCGFLQDATEDLVRVIEAYRTGDRGRVADVEAEVDLPYVTEQVPLAIERALQGLERVSSIVKSMKEFAHPDQSLPAFADINRAITSTATVARNEYKYVADLETELGDLPPVSCHVGELNQVLLNIVVNAAHAIETRVKDTDQRGRIVIRTRPHDGYAVIEIADDGCGIPRAIIDKVFDPFFTTKEIGKGTGQGLAIARSVIVDKHHGKLTVDSEPGAGTTFQIWLPLAVDAPAEVRLAS